MEDFLVILQIFQKESNFGGSLLYCHINRDEFLPNLKFRVFVIQNGYMLFLTC